MIGEGSGTGCVVPCTSIGAGVELKARVALAPFEFVGMIICVVGVVLLALLEAIALVSPSRAHSNLCWSS